MGTKPVFPHTLTPSFTDYETEEEEEEENPHLEDDVDIQGHDSELEEEEEEPAQPLEPYKPIRRPPRGKELLSQRIRLRKEEEYEEDYGNYSEDRENIAPDTQKMSNGKGRTGPIKDRSLTSLRAENRNLLKTNQKLVESNKHLTQDNSDFKAQNHFLDEENTRLRIENAQLRRAQPAGSKAMKNKGLVAMLKKTAKEKTFRTIKFIQSDAEAVKAAEVTLDLSELAEYIGDDEATKTKRVEAVGLYSSDILQAINEQRSIVQTNMGKIAKCLYDKDGKLPETEVFAEVVARTSKDEAMIDYWLHELCPVAAGVKNLPKKVLNYTIISEAKCQHDQQKLAFPAVSEAFALLCYENCREKWVKIWKFKQENPGDKVPVANKETANDDRYSSKYTVATKGVQKFGGWTQDGLDAFGKYVDMAIAGRKLKESKKFEKDSLDRVKKRKGITGDSLEPPKKKQKNTKKAPAAPHVARSFLAVEEI